MEKQAKLFFAAACLVACVRVGLNEVVLVSHQPLCFRGERFTNKSVICTWFVTKPTRARFYGAWYGNQAWFVRHLLWSLIWYVCQLISRAKIEFCCCGWFGAILLLPHSVEAFCSLSAYFKSMHIINLLLLLQFSYLVEVFALCQIKTGGLCLSLFLSEPLSLSLSRRRNWECFSKIGGRSAQMTMPFKKLLIELHFRRRNVIC